MKKFNIYEMITEKIISQLDKGIIPWDKPWHGGGGCISRTTGKPYSLLNQMLLMTSFPEGGEFATMKQINKEGGRVNKGAKAQQVVFWKLYPTKIKNKDNVEEDAVIPVLRYYNVFHISDTDLKPKYSEKPIKHADPNKEAEDILQEYWKREGIKVERTALSDRAYYSPMIDKIVLPAIEQFESTAEYYSTAFHESVHSTGHKDRLDRKLNSIESMQKGNYAREELVAEIGAFTLTNYCGINTESSDKNSTAYIQGWRNAIAKDNKLIVTATGKAEKAVNYILGEEKKEDEIEA